MAWFADTYAHMNPERVRHDTLRIVTGKPVEMGGSAGREKATGQGMVDVLEEMLPELQIDIGKMTFSLIGFGNVGGWTGRLLKERGASLLAVLDHTGAIYNDGGINTRLLAEYTARTGGVLGFPEAEPISEREFYAVHVDVLIPAALERMITPEKAELINARVVAEAANAPTTPEGDLVLQQRGIEITSGQQVMEHARLIKGADEINAMRCAMASCEIAVEAMRREIRPGIAEVELWAVLHAENIKRGGEWIETRILSSGPRTNPWMQEAGPRRIADGDLVALDTDLIGPYGMCADISRTWYCGDGAPSDEQRRLHGIAHEHITANQAILKPGVSFPELTELGHRLPEEFRAQRYGVKYHGVGLCDEFPCIYYPEDVIAGAFDYVLEPGMVLCVEAYIGAVGGRHGVKLENQVLITETGSENLTRCPFDQRLLAYTKEQ